MTLSSHPVPPRLLARFLDHEPVELARGQDHTQLADIRALTAQAGICLTPPTPEPPAASRSTCPSASPASR